MCRCLCGCIKNFAVRIIYIIVTLAIFVALGLIPLDAMSGYGGFVGIPKDKNACKNVSITQQHQVNIEGIFYKITWAKNATTLVHNGDQTCAIYNPKNTQISGSVTKCDLNDYLVKFTQFDKLNVTCLAYINEDNLNTLNDLSKVYLGSLGAIVALALVTVIAILCILICCAGWCSCSCCFLCKSCCLLRG